MGAISKNSPICCGDKPFLRNCYFNENVAGFQKFYPGRIHLTTRRPNPKTTSGIPKSPTTENYLPATSGIGQSDLQ
jgi:hypothetical protein